LDFKRPWSDGTSAVTLEPLALIARLAALVPPPKRHTVRYFGVLSSHAAARSLVVPQPAPEAQAAGAEKPGGKSRYIPWAELLRRTFTIACGASRLCRLRSVVGGFGNPPRVPISIDIKCGKCGKPLRLLALIKTEAVIKKILLAMHLPAEAPELHPARPPPGAEREARGGEAMQN